MQKKVIPFLFVYLVLCCLAGHTQNSTDSVSQVTLKQCVDLAIKNNLLVQQSDITMQTTKVQYNQSVGNMLPQIYGQASQQLGFGRILNTYTYTYLNQQLNSGSYSANANLTLFSGLSLLNSLKQNALAYNASKLDLQQQKESITLSVILGYLTVLNNRDLLAISREQADVDLKQVNRLQLQSDAGALLLLSNLSDLKGQYAGDLVNISTAVDNLETSKVNLFQLLNVPYNKNIQLEDIMLDLQASDTTTSSESIYRTALQTLPEIKSADLKIRAFQRGLAAVRGNTTHLVLLRQREHYFFQCSHRFDSR